ncbi:MAG: rRNA maturation RNase YbeY [Balneolaceae bacterium]|nr:rRNA maturation RNase YbeY [Balneolaceae bacterium]
MTKNKFFSHNAYSGIHLFNESEADIPVSHQVLQAIAASVENEESCSFQLVEAVFVDEDEIVRINQEHLERNYVTDIISFRYDDDPGNQSIEGTLYCCAPRIAEQADEFNEPPETEFKRIIIHGLLHLIGYDDQSPKAQKTMRQKEEYFLGRV